MNKSFKKKSFKAFQRLFSQHLNHLRNLAKLETYMDLLPLSDHRMVWYCFSSLETGNLIFS